MASQGRRQLLTIPVELFERIAREVPREDLPKLRLLCKDAANKVLNVFTKEHFEEIAGLLSNEDGLRTLLAIAEHETFGQAVKKIHLCVDDVPQIEGGATIGSAPNRNREEDLHQEMYIPACKTYQEARANMSECGRDLDLLVNIFKAMKRNGNRIEVNLTDQIYIDMIAKGSGSLKLATGDEYHDSNSEKDYTYLVLDALERCALPLYGLSMCQTAEWRTGAFPPWCIFSLATGRPHVLRTSTVFQHLRHLALQSRLIQNFRGVTGHQVRDLVGILVNMPYLEELRTDFCSESCTHTAPNPDYAFANYLLSAKLPSLQSFRLVGMRVDVTLLLSFIERHDMLENLSVHGCTVITLSHEGVGRDSLTVKLREVLDQTSAKNISVQWIGDGSVRRDYVRDNYPTRPGMFSKYPSWPLVSDHRFRDGRMPGGPRFPSLF